MVGELAAGQVADVQLDHVGGHHQAIAVVFHECLRRGRHRIAAPRAITQDELDVLAGVVIEGLVGRQLQAHQHHVV